MQESDALIELFWRISVADIVALYFPHVATAEGPVAHLYLDIYGHLTIGYGHLLLNRKELANKNWRTTLKAEAGRLWGYQLKTIDSRQYNLWTGGKYAPARLANVPMQAKQKLPESIHKYGRGESSGTHVSLNVYCRSFFFYVQIIN